jgi:hypothetical protein
LLDRTRELLAGSFHFGAQSGHSFVERLALALQLGALPVDLGAMTRGHAIELASSLRPVISHWMPVLTGRPIADVGRIEEQTRKWSRCSGRTP